MIYRKASPTPPKLLLRIVLTAGAGALLGAAACSSTRVQGLSTDPEQATDGGDAGDHGASRFEDASACNYDFCVPSGGTGTGVIVFPPDAAPRKEGDAAASADADAGAMDSGAWDAGCHMVCGSAILPPDGGPPGPSCFEVCERIDP